MMRKGKQSWYNKTDEDESQVPALMKFVKTSAFANTVAEFLDTTDVFADEKRTAKKSRGRSPTNVARSKTSSPPPVVVDWKVGALRQVLSNALMTAGDAAYEQKFQQPSSINPEKEKSRRHRNHSESPSKDTVAL